jgi:hypothetical protein
MLQNVSAETIYCHERARQAREKADAATAAEARSDHLAAEAQWLALGHSHELQRRLSATLGGNASIAQMARALDPEVVAIISCVQCGVSQTAAAEVGNFPEAERT